jgi:hypothetical protein
VPVALLPQHICTLEHPGVQRGAEVRLSHAPSARSINAPSEAKATWE